MRIHPSIAAAALAALLCPKAVSACHADCRANCQAGCTTPCAVFAADSPRPIVGPAPADLTWHHTATPPPVGNGRPFVQRVFTRDPATSTVDPAIARLGAPAGAQDRIRVRDGGLVRTISPWRPIPHEGLNDLEQARQFWLREQGFTGGVRTFRNPNPPPARTENPAAAEPAGWFRVPPDMPRTRSRESVRLSLPPGFDPAAADALRSRFMASDDAVAQR